MVARPTSVPLLSTLACPRSPGLIRLRERREPCPAVTLSVQGSGEGAVPLEIPDYYPLSPAARRAIVSVEASSERDLRAALASIIRRRTLSRAHTQLVKTETIRYVITVVLEFGKHICDVARTGFAHVDRLPGMVEQRMDVVALYAYSGLGLNDYTMQIWRTDHQCRREIADEIKGSAEWLTFLAALALRKSLPPNH